MIEDAIIELEDVQSSTARAIDELHAARTLLDDGEVADDSERETAIAGIDAARNALAGPQSLMDITEMLHEAEDQIRELPEVE